MGKAKKKTVISKKEEQQAQKVDDQNESGRQCTDHTACNCG